MLRLKKPWPVAVLLLLFGTATAWLAGCDGSPSLTTPTSTSSPPTDAPATSTDTSATPAEAAVFPTEGEEATPSAPSTITLTVWTTEAFSPTQTITSGQILAQQVAIFEDNHPDVQIEFLLKKPYGKGGILDFLLTTQAVVPALLPDLVFIDVDELGSAIQAQVVQSLDDLLLPDLVADLYPFARQAGTFDGRLYGLQFQADLDHLVYNTGRLTVPPRSWPGVLSNPGPYLFPAGGQAGLVNDDFMIQYLAIRPWPSEDNPEEPFLELDSLTAVLQFYRDGVSRGVFPVDILNYHTTDDSWRDYLAGRGALAHVGVHRYLAERDQALASAIAPIPAINGAGPAISRGWALALVTADPARQSLAIEFATQLLSPTVNAAWNRSTGYLPTRRAAWANWGDEEEGYTRFLGQQLQTAQPRPHLLNYTQVAAALQEAVVAVISGTAAPEEAAAQAIEKAQ